MIAPQDIRTADPIVASDIYSGFFALGGKVVDAHGRSPFDIEPASAAWAEMLHGFSWLRHLRAADTSLARANAQALVGDWMAASRRGGPPVAWLAPVMARRLLSWLSQSPIVLDGADGRFYRRLMRSIARQATILQRQVDGGLDGEARLWAVLALAEVSLCAENGAPFRRGSRQFLDELNRQVLGDGGHVSRDPALLVDLLLDLLPLRQAYAARGAEVPLPLLNAIDRMMPMLRMFRHSDGTLALFNGMGVTQPDFVATILAYDDSRTLPLTNAPYSGYQRLEAGPSVLICDMGAPPPVAFATRAHAGPLSFEFSSGANRLIVNCGRLSTAAPSAIAAARSTAAHSTLILADQSAGGFLAVPGFAAELDGALVGGASPIVVKRRIEAGGAALEATHDGYASAFGLLHRRHLTLSDDGLRLEGVDSLLEASTGGGGPVPAALRFHLHPAARPSVQRPTVPASCCRPRAGQRWLFEAAGLGRLSIEPSILFASAEGPRQTGQIVIEAEGRGGPRPALVADPARLARFDRSAAAFPPGDRSMVLPPPRPIDRSAASPIAGGMAGLWRAFGPAQVRSMRPDDQSDGPHGKRSPPDQTGSPLRVGQDRPCRFRRLPRGAGHRADLHRRHAARPASPMAWTVLDVADVTGFPELMDGRLKTLHPNIHGGLLAIRENPAHEAAMLAHAIRPIDLLVVNLYPFEATVAAGGDYDACIETIDIGGPAMIRGAAKNHGDVDGGGRCRRLRRHPRRDSPPTRVRPPAVFRRRMAQKALARTAAYDAAISNWLAGTLDDRRGAALPGARRHARRGTALRREPPPVKPPSTARPRRGPGVATARQVQGKPLSYNNLADTDAAFELVAEFDPAAGAAVAIIKHANPCGAATGDTLLAAYRKALACDPVSAFGGIVACNHPLDAAAARGDRQDLHRGDHRPRRRATKRSPSSPPRRTCGCC